MRLLVDGCLSPATVSRLTAAGHDVEWVGGWPKDPGDRDIVAAAHAHGRVLITIDRGFGALAMRERQVQGGIIVIRRALAIEHAALALRVIELHANDLANNAIIIATPTRIRVRWPKPHA